MHQSQYKQIEIGGDTWDALGTRDDGKVYAHLASTTRFRQQRNRKCPIQMADWIDETLVQRAN